MPKAKRKISRVKSRRGGKADPWPNLQFGQESNGNKKFPLPVRVIVTVCVLAAIALAAGLWHCSRSCRNAPVNPEGQPQARQVIPPPMMPPPQPQRPPSIFRAPVRPNAAVASPQVSSMPRSGEVSAAKRPERIVFRAGKNQPMVLMPRRSDTQGVEASISNNQSQVFWTAAKPAGKPGRVRLEWDGKDKQGKPLPAGKYIVKIKSAEGDDVKELKVMP